MVSISDNGIITMYRGDTFQVPMRINTGSKLDPIWYEVQPGDTIYFSVCEPNQLFEEALIRKMVTSANQDIDKNIYIYLDPTDTQNVVPGTYYMEAKIKLTNGKIATIVPRRKFFIFE